MKNCARALKDAEEFDKKLGNVTFCSAYAQRMLGISSAKAGCKLGVLKRPLTNGNKNQVKFHS